jgi:hypothetical protein
MEIINQFAKLFWRALVTRINRRLDVMAPIGYEDETGFHPSGLNSGCK